MNPIVVKVGGSLYDRSDLASRLTVYLDSLAPPVLLVPGGGRTADAIRRFDDSLALGEESAHWLALRVCTVNGHMLADLLGIPLTTDLRIDVPRAVVDLFGFATADESRTDRLPHAWDVTTDSIAVRVAQVTSARELVLLKSAPMTWESWLDARSAGYVDRYFPEALARTPNLKVSAVDFRA